MKVYDVCFLQKNTAKNTGIENAIRARIEDNFAEVFTNSPQYAYESDLFLMQGDVVIIHDVKNDPNYWASDAFMSFGIVMGTSTFPPRGRKIIARIEWGSSLEYARKLARQERLLQYMEQLLIEKESMHKFEVIAAKDTQMAEFLEEYKQNLEELKKV